jgi:hypothetical protein
MAGPKSKRSTQQRVQIRGRAFAEVAKFARVCACDRPGMPVGEKPSRSDPGAAADHGPFPV